MQRWVNCNDCQYEKNILGGYLFRYFCRMSNHNSHMGLAERGWGIKSFLCEEWRNFTYFVLSTRFKRFWDFKKWRLQWLKYFKYIFKSLNKHYVFFRQCICCVLYHQSSLSFSFLTVAESEWVVDAASPQFNTSSFDVLNISYQSDLYVFHFLMQ